MYSKICKWCNKLIEVDKQCLYALHVSNCDSNPKKEERIRKNSEKFKGVEKSKRIELKQKCSKCNNIFYIRITENDFDKGKYNKFCSRKCANSRNHSDETKNKISKTLTDKGCHSHTVLLKCEYCEKEFEIKWAKRNQKYCSISCASKKRGGWLTVHNSNINWSKVNKKSYDTGKNYVAGGTTKWLEYKDIRVQGTYELRACYILDKMKEINLIKDWEYGKVRIKYIGIDKNEHTYIIDFRIINNNDSIKNLEIKGRIKEDDYNKWESAKKLGLDFEVWFLEDIKKYEQKYLNNLSTWVNWK